MGVAKKTRKFAETKRIIGKRDARLGENKNKADIVQQTKKKATANGELIREIPQQPAAMFFQHNSNLVAPYQILVDTNFFTHSIGSHLEGIEQDMTRFLEASCHLIVTSCVMAELEKLGHKYKIALKIAREIIAQDDHSGTGHRMLQCAHKGTYADECIYDRCARNRIYLVATNDREFRKRLRKIPGVPLIAVDKEKGKYRIERLPNAPY